MWNITKGVPAISATYEPIAGKNIPQRFARNARAINSLSGRERLSTNQEAGSSNLSGRTIINNLAAVEFLMCRIFLSVWNIFGVRSDICGRDF